MKIYGSLFLFLIPLLHFSQPNTEIFLFDLDANDGKFELSNFKNISDNEGYDNQPSFLDNHTILFASTRNDQTDILIYSIDDGSKSWICNTEGGEYSPLKIPNQEAVSAIRLDPDGKQLLYRYNIKDGTSKPLMDTLVVGYHTWFDKNTIISSVLEGDLMSVFITDLKTHQNKKMDTNVGRSLHKIPNSDWVSYISKKNAVWTINALNPTTEKTKFIANTLPEIEDMVWLNASTIIMGKGDKLYKLNIKTDTYWTELTSIQNYNIKNITRLAISPNGKKMAIVGELSGQKLEPKLENIKWISGNWKGEAFGGQTEENWSEPSGGSMMATFKLIDNGKVAFYEIEIIREVENSLILQLKHFNSDLKGWETKEETVDFPLKEITADKAIFEGMTFEKISNNEMTVYVDIHQEDGTIKTVKFNYKK